MFCIEIVIPSGLAAWLPSSWLPGRAQWSEHMGALKLATDSRSKNLEMNLRRCLSLRGKCNRTKGGRRISRPRYSCYIQELLLSELGWAYTHPPISGFT